MIKVEHIDVHGFEAAIRGMRNPHDSWDKSDSGYFFNTGDYYVGANDLDLMQRLAKAGTEHRKYLRMITVTMDITAPLYWWKEFDTYKVGTVANSCSTMHKIHSKEFIIDDFSCQHLNRTGTPILWDVIETLNFCRQQYLETKDKQWWWQMIQLLPSRMVNRSIRQQTHSIHPTCDHCVA